MNPLEQAWFAFSSPDSTTLDCAACGHEIDPGPASDHHPRVCPNCRIESAFLHWKGRTVQIVPSKAPPAFVAVLRLGQQHLDELEYAEFICALEVFSESLNALAAHT